MAIGINKIVVIHKGEEHTWKRFYIRAGKKIQVKAEYYPDTPVSKRGSAKWIVKPKKDSPFSKNDHGLKIGDSRSISLPAKYCGPKEFVIEAFMTQPENKYPTQLVFYGKAPEKIISTKWSKKEGGADLKQSHIKYGEEVWLNLDTEGLNGAILEVDIYNDQWRDDGYVCTITNVQCLFGEVNLRIGNTATWKDSTGLIFTEIEKFYAQVRKSGSKNLVTNEGGKKFLHVFKETVTREVTKHKNAKPFTVEENEVNVERYELCRFTKIAITEKGEAPITLFEEGNVILDNQTKTYFQASASIHFDFNKSNLRSGDKAKLDGLVQLLLDNPYLPAEIGAHCDNRGSHDYNDKLSIRRAIATVDYLVSRGVSKDTINARGYGERKLLIEGDDLSEAEHQLNRRATIRFKIFGGDAESIVYQTIAPDIERKKELTLDITDYKTEECLRKFNPDKKHDSKVVKVIELTTNGSNGTYTYNGEETIKHEVFSNLSKSRFVPLDYIWPHKTTTNDFKYFINSCRYYADKKKPALIVKVYPDIKWGFHFFLNLSNQLSVKWQNLGAAKHKEMQSKAGEIGAEKRWKQTEIDFGVLIEAEWNKISDTNYSEREELSLKFEARIKQLYTIFAQLKEASKIITGNTKSKAIATVGKKFPIGIEMKPPNFCLGATWLLARGVKKNKRIKELGTLVEFYFKAQPLIGLEITLDLLQAAMGATGPAAPILIGIKDWLGAEEHGLRVELYVNLIVFGTMQIDNLALQYNTASDNTDPDRKVEFDASSTIGLTLEAGLEIKAEVVILIAKFYGEGIAKIEGTGSITFGHSIIYQSQKLNYRPKMLFDGLKATVTVSAKIGLQIKKGWFEGDYNKDLVDFKDEYDLFEPFDIIKKIEKMTGKSASITLIG